MNLSEREKIILTLGVILLTLFLFTTGWFWLSNTVVSLQHRVQQNKTLLVWMQYADQQLQQNGPANASSGSDQGTLSAHIHSLLNQMNLAGHVSLLRQNEDGSVRVSLKKVDFDQLARLLDRLSQQYRAKAEQIHIVRVNESGSVDADMALR